MRPAFTDEGLEALFFDEADALHVCYHEKDIQGAILRLDNMMAIVRALEPPPPVLLYEEGVA